MRAILEAVSRALTVVDALEPLRRDPARGAVLLDVDGTLAPIVRHADDAHVPEATRGILIAVAKRYGLVACISGRRATTARRMVAIGSIAYVGNHGGELLRPGATVAELDPDASAWVRRIRDFAQSAWTPELHRLRVRGEDKEAIAAFHWRGAPDEAAAERAVGEVAARAEAAGLRSHWGRKVLEVRPPVTLDKGRAVTRLLADADASTALFIGDDTTDVDAFHAMRALVDEGMLEEAVCVGVRSEETPPIVEQHADLLVDGPAGVRAALEALLET
jgi:trehalose 6-phosphate phosphatase